MNKSILLHLFCITSLSIGYANEDQPFEAVPSEDSWMAGENCERGRETSSSNDSAIEGTDTKDVDQFTREYTESPENYRESWPPLTYAIAHGYKDKALELIAQGHDANGYSYYHETSALWEAIRQNDLEMVANLLNAGADVMGPIRVYYRGSHWGDHYELQPMWAALSSEVDLSIFTLLLEHGADPHYGEGYGYGILSWAANLGALEKFELLLSHGANPCKVIKAIESDNTEWNLLSDVCELDNKTESIPRLAMLEKLIALGLDVNFHTGWRESPIETAACNGWREGVECLIGYGADINEGSVKEWTESRWDKNTNSWLKDSYSGRTTLIGSAISGMPSSAPLEICAMVELLMTLGADINVESVYSHGPTFAAPPLAYAVHSKNYDLARFLLEHGAHLEFMIRGEYEGYTPLLLAIEHHDEKMARYLVSFGANPNNRGGTPYSPLELAKKKTGMTRLVRDLLEVGASQEGK